MPSTLPRAAHLTFDFSDYPCPAEPRDEHAPSGLCLCGEYEWEDFTARCDELLAEVGEQYWAASVTTQPGRPWARTEPSDDVNGGVDMATLTTLVSLEAMGGCGTMTLNWDGVRTLTWFDSTQRLNLAALTDGEFEELRRWENECPYSLYPAFLMLNTEPSVAAAAWKVWEQAELGNSSMVYFEDLLARVEVAGPGLASTDYIAALRSLVADRQSYTGSRVLDIAAAIASG